MGPFLTHWTIRLALVCFVACVTTAIVRGTWGRAKWERIVWTLGLGFFVAHVAAAFHFYHEWSHERAFVTTAEQTEKLLGLRFGEGIYFSYLFTVLWLADVAWWWLNAETYQQRPRMIVGALIAYLFFIAFNGAIIFEAGITRPVGIVVCALLAGLVVYRLAWLPRGGRRSAKNVAMS